MTPPVPATMAEVDLTDLDHFADGFPHHLFALHRREAPVYWHEPTAHTPGGEGFWSVATHAEVQRVQLDPVTYSSEGGGDRSGGGTLLEDLDVAGLVLNMMDEPRHGRVRRLVTAGLTPRTVRRLEDELRRRTTALLDAVPDGEPVDFLTTVAAELPMQAICILLGVPQEDRHRLAESVDAGFDVKDGDDGSFAVAGLFEYAVDLVAEKRARPTDDMLSVAVHATLPEVEPPQLSDLELWSFFSLLFAAGAETTRNAIAGGLLALVERPDQLRALRDDRSLLGSTLEEVLRWTTPSPAKRRTATRAAELGGHEVAPGAKVLFWEGSANRDESVFDDPMSFDIRRAPNPHLSFGHGIHFCLGANLARLEMRVLYEELLDRFASVELAGPPEWTRSNRHSGLRHLPMVLRR